MSDGNTHDLKVVFITGSGRSGSTLLDRVLGQVDGIFSAGELRGIAERSVIGNRLCGCGKPFRECEVWQKVFKDAFGGFDGFDADRFIYLKESVTRTGSMMRMASRLKSDTVEEAVEYTAIMEKLYRSIAKVTGDHVIIDSSKYPSHAHLISQNSTLQVYQLHLVRDARAVAHSWQRKKLKNDTVKPEYMPIEHPVQSAIGWLTWNYAANVLPVRTDSKYLRIRYKDFVRRPQEMAALVMEFLEEKQLPPFVDDKTVRMKPNHTVSGNPARFHNGNVKIREDKEWRENIRPATKFWATLIGAPLLARYGYFKKSRRSKP